MLPTVFGEAAQIVIEEAKVWKPDVVLCIGLAAGRNAVTPERIGVNIRDARIPDNAGNWSTGERIIPEGPAAYFSTVPVEKMVQAIRDAEIPATVSNSAGTFVCNDVLYSLLHHFSNATTRIGFIHVPPLPEQSEIGMPLNKIVTALSVAILACG